MSPSVHFAPISWDGYAALQANAEQRQRLNHKLWALEDQMDSLLNSFGNGEEVESHAHSAKRLQNLATNRAKKHRHRDRLLRVEYAPTCPVDVECKKLDYLCHHETITQVREQVTAKEWATFEMLADGDDYATIAIHQQLTVPALKSRICRCRERLRAIAR